ncbi:hypothetical protein SCUP234_07571 [Seiridium cupressi]
MQAVTRLLTLAALLASCVSAVPTSARGNSIQLPPTNITSAAGAANETEPPFIGTDEASPLPDGAVGEDTTISTFGLGDKNADLLAEFEFQDLLKRFELLECWDAGYQHFDGSEEWDCGDWRFLNWYNLYWHDGRDTWDGANRGARDFIADPKEDVRNGHYYWETWNVLAFGARGWAPRST